MEENRHDSKKFKRIPSSIFRPTLPSNRRFCFPRAGGTPAHHHRPFNRGLPRTWLSQIWHERALQKIQYASATFCSFFFHIFSLFFVFFYTFFLFFFVFFFSFCFITDQRAARHISVLLLITRRCRVFFFRLATSVYESSGPGEGLRRGEGADPSISL